MIVASVNKNFIMDRRYYFLIRVLCLFSNKLYSQWSGPFVVKEIFLHGVMEITSLNNKNIFKVNGQRLKAYHEDEDQVKFFVDLLQIFLKNHHP